MGCGCDSCRRSVALGAPHRSRMTRARGMGDLFADLASQSAEFAGAWGKVQDQLHAEGASDLDLSAAKQSLANAFSQIVSNPQGFNLSSSDALKAATDFTIAGRTVLGAVDQVQGLIAASQGSDPTQAFQMVTGTLIGVAVAAGALSAGIGSVIVVGVGAALSLMQSAGLFGSPPQGQQICNGLWINPPPTLQVGCVGANAQAVKNGSPYWRHYPKRSGGNTNDAAWFQSSYAAAWSGSATGPMSTWMGFSDTRLIDSAFPEAHYLACQHVPSALAGLNAAFLSAWTANKEYALNGLKAQPDWIVLEHTLRAWNKAHQPSSTYDLRYVARPALSKVTIDPTGKIVGPCPSDLPPYVATLVSDLIFNLNTNDALLSRSGGILVHTGPEVKAPVRKIVLKIAPLIKAPVDAVRATPWTASPASPSSAGSALLWTGIAVAGAGAFYAYRQKKRRQPIVPKAIRARAQKLRRTLHV